MVSGGYWLRELHKSTFFFKAPVAKSIEGVKNKA